VQGSRTSVVGARAGLVCDESLTVSGHYHVGAALGVRMQSPGGIEFLCGKSRLVLLPDRILLERQLQAAQAINLVTRSNPPWSWMGPPHWQAAKPLFQADKAAFSCSTLKPSSTVRL
jgi:hypothetical protein